MGSQKWRKGRNVCAIEQVDPSPSPLLCVMLMTDCSGRFGVNPVTDKSYWLWLLKPQVSVDAHNKVGKTRNGFWNRISMFMTCLLLEISLFYIDNSRSFADTNSHRSRSILYCKPHLIQILQVLTRRFWMPTWDNTVDLHFKNQITVSLLSFLHFPQT